MATNTNFVISYTGDFNSITRQLKNFERINTAIAQKMGSEFASNIQIISQSLDKIQSKPVFDAKGIQTGTATVAQFSTVFKDGAGNLKTFTEQAQVTNGGIQSLNSTIKNGGTVSRTFADDLKTLASRAALTIPIWLLLRGAILGVFTNIRDGFNNLVKFDEALQKVRRNLSGSQADIEVQFRTLREELTKFSVQTGISTETLAESVKKFASLGFNLQESLAGGLGSAKLSKVLFGDAAETADAFARSLNLLIDRSKGAKDATEQMNELFALTAELEKTNQFEIAEVNASLKTFAGTAKSLGLTGRETFAILATLGTNLLEGARGGTLASAAFQQLIGNLKKVSGVLGISVNPQVESTTQIFTKVIDEIERLGQTNIEEQTRAISTLFGGLKGAKPVRALISDLQRLRDNLKVTASVQDFNAQFNRINDTIASQVVIFHNLNKEIGKAFITGVVGGSDFKDSLKIVNDILKEVQKNAQGFGEGLTDIASGLITLNPGITFWSGYAREVKKAANEVERIQILISQGLKGQLTSNDLTALIKNLTIKLNAGDTKTPGVDVRTIGLLRKQLQDGVQKEIDKQAIDVTANVRFKSISFISVKENQNILKAIIQSQLESLKSQGASTSEILKQESLLNKQFNIYEDENSILERQLATQRALTDETRLQNRLSSDSLKLFDIAQTNGVDIAKQIGDVLAGNVDFNQFVRRGGEALDVFKQQFSETFKQQQATAFFQGTISPGVNTLQGGTSVPIQETALQNGLPTAFNAQAQIAAARTINQIPTIRNDIQARIDMNVNVQGLSFREAVEKMKDEMAKEILNPQGKISQAVDQKIENF